MASTLSSLSRKYSTLRNVLPFLVRQTYITNASLPLPYHALQVKPLDKINLRLPASRFESALTDVVVIVCARECEVVRQQDVDRAPVLFLPCRILFADSLFAFRAQSGLGVRTRDLPECPPPQPVRRHPPRASSGATLLSFSWLISPLHYPACGCDANVVGMSVLPAGLFLGRRNSNST